MVNGEWSMHFAIEEAVASSRVQVAGNENNFCISLQPETWNLKLGIRTLK
jgi:hypothetical protein